MSKKTDRLIEEATAELRIKNHKLGRELDAHKETTKYWKDSYYVLGGANARAHDNLAKANVRIAELEAVLKAARRYALEDERNGKEDASDAAKLRQRIEASMPAKPLTVQQQEANLIASVFAVYQP